MKKGNFGDLLDDLQDFRKKLKRQFGVQENNVSFIPSKSPDSKSKTPKRLFQLDPSPYESRRKYKNFKDKIKLQHEIQKSFTTKRKYQPPQLRENSDFINRSPYQSTMPVKQQFQILNQRRSQDQPESSRHDFLTSQYSSPTYIDWKENKSLSNKAVHITDRMLSYPQLVKFVNELEQLREEEQAEIPPEYMKDLLKLSFVIHNTFGRRI